MIHEVTIPFAFDTSPIENQIAAIGQSEVLKVVEKVIKQGVYKVLPKKPPHYSYYEKVKSDDDIDWSSLIRDMFSKWLDSHTQDIVDEASLLLAMKASRKKAWREILAELKEGQHDLDA